EADGGDLDDALLVALGGDVEAVVADAAQARLDLPAHAALFAAVHVGAEADGLPGAQRLLVRADADGDRQEADADLGALAGVGDARRAHHHGGGRRQRLWRPVEPGVGDGAVLLPAVHAPDDAFLLAVMDLGAELDRGAQPRGGPARGGLYPDRRDMEQR